MAKESQGIIFYWTEATTGTTAVAVGEIVGFSGPSMTGNPIDVTNLTATAKTKLMGVYDGGQITFNVNMVVTDAGQTLIRTSFTARTLGAGIIKLDASATSQKCAFLGYVSGFNITGSVDNKLAGDITIAITQGVTYTT